MEEADLGHLAACASLEFLQLGSSTAMSDLSPLASCPRLRDLRLANCLALASLEPLAACRAPRTLVSDLALVWGFNTAPALTTLHARNIFPALSQSFPQHLMARLQQPGLERASHLGGASIPVVLD